MQQSFSSGIQMLSMQIRVLLLKDVPEGTLEGAQAKLHSLKTKDCC